MKDYYKILGVEEGASEEEIRARWIELRKYYPADLEKTEEGGEKIREINEAYEILKNEATRYHYDFERDLKKSFIKRAHRRQERRINILKILIIPSGILVLFLIIGFFLFRRADVATPPRTGAKTEAFYKIGKVLEKETALQTPPMQTDSKAPEETGVPREIKKEVMPPESKRVVSLSSGLSASAVERESGQKKEPTQKILLESKVPTRVEKEGPKAAKKEILRENTRIASAPSLPPADKESEGEKKPTQQVAMISEKPVVKEVSKEIQKEVAKEVPKDTPGEVPKEVLKEVPEEVSKEISKGIPKEVPKELPVEAPKETIKEVPQEVPKEVSKDTPGEAVRVTLHPGEKLTIWTKEERVASSRPSLLAKEEEVKEFFSHYVDRYHRKDVGGLLSFFSSKAIQNQKEGLKAISSLYTELIDQSEELRYQIQGMKMEIYQNRVEVSARFRVDQRLKKSGEEKVWKGNIRWVLVKEEGRLKIISLDYQNEKFP